MQWTVTIMYQPRDVWPLPIAAYLTPFAIAWSGVVALWSSVRLIPSNGS